MKTEHLDKLLSNPATPDWVSEVSRRLESVDIVDAINGLEALARTLDADHKAHVEQQLARHQRKLTAQASKHQWRGINWLHVSYIEQGSGGSVVVHFIHDRPPHTLDHYPGEGTFVRAENCLYLARRSRNRRNGQ